MRLHAIVLAFILVAASTGVALAADVILIVNKANGDTSISSQDANNIFLGKKTTWSNGKKIALVTQQNQQVNESFTMQVLGKTAQQFATYWKKALFTGVGTPPKAVEGDADVKAFVVANKDAIGYISASSLDGTVKKLVIN